MSGNIFRDSYAGQEPHEQQNDAAQAPANRPKKKSFMNLPGGGKAIFAFALSLFAYTLQTEFAQYVQQALNYRKPFLSLYLGHSGFLLLFPMHLFFLKWTTKRPITHYLHLIAQNLRWQLDTAPSSLPDPRADEVRRRLSRASGRGSQAFSDADHAEQGGMIRRKVSFLEETFGFNVLRLAGLFVVLTIGITIPALSWYCAVPMTSMADITAIYNTFSVWALVFSVWFLGEKWEKRKVFSVLLACLGVIIVAYGGADHRKVPKPVDPVHGKPPADTDPAVRLVHRSIAAAVSRVFTRREAPADVPVSSAHNPVLGDLLAFIGAVTMAAYEMAFKLIGTLPDEIKQAEMYSAVPGGRNRRSRSYVRYQDPEHDDSRTDYETEGLLRSSQSEARATDGDARALHAGNGDGAHHILGDDEQDVTETAKKHELDERRSLSTLADKLISQERPDYQSITPPPEPSNPFAEEDASKIAKETADRVRVHAKAVPSSETKRRDDDEDSQVTESELDEEEEELVLAGATRLHRTRSHLSTHHLADASYADGDESSHNVSAARISTDATRPGVSRRSSTYRKVHDPSIPPPLPFGLHANVMTAGIGLTTFTTFWIGIVLAHQLGWETFELPHNLRTYVSIAMVVWCGIFFNAAFMILLSLWGPVLASVSCLMTTILVEIADVLLGHRLKWISVLGCTLIGAGFAVLVGGDSIH